jgi:hypothetical protein
MSVFALQNLLVGSVQTDTYKYRQIHTDTDKIKLRDTDKYIQIHADKCIVCIVCICLYCMYLYLA